MIIGPANFMKRLTAQGLPRTENQTPRPAPVTPWKVSPTPASTAQQTKEVIMSDSDRKLSKTTEPVKQDAMGAASIGSDSTYYLANVKAEQVPEHLKSRVAVTKPGRGIS
jgi:hypothetical protein